MCSWPTAQGQSGGPMVSLVQWSNGPSPASRGPEQQHAFSTTPLHASAFVTTIDGSRKRISVTTKETNDANKASICCFISSTTSFWPFTAARPWLQSRRVLLPWNEQGKNCTVGRRIFLKNCIVETGGIILSRERERCDVLVVVVKKMELF
jgi:hypothetical protein